MRDHTESQEDAVIELGAASELTKGARDEDFEGPDKLI
jgi:hypothetical protein